MQRPRTQDAFLATFRLKTQAI